MWAAFFMANVHFARAGSDYFAQGQPPSPVQQFWTLAVEEQFYLVWPVVLAARAGGSVPAAPAALDRARGSRRLARVVGPQHRDRRRLRVLLHGHARLGARARRGAGDRRATAARELPPGSASRASASPASPSRARRPSPATRRCCRRSGAALVIAAAPGSASRLLSLAPFRYVGDRSYAFYLWHWPVLVIAAEYAGHDLSTAVRLGLLAGAFGLSILSYAALREPDQEDELAPADRRAALARLGGRDPRGRGADPGLAERAGDADLERGRRGPPGRAGRADDRRARLLAAAAGGRRTRSTRPSGTPPAVAADARGDRPAQRLLRLPRRMRRRPRPDLEHGLPPRRPGRGEDDRRDRRLARADVDADDPEDGPA